MAKDSLDKVDLSILKIIQNDAALSVSDIAERVNLSQPPCWRRIKQLESEGYIDRRVGVLNRKALGFNLVLYAQIKLSANGRKAVDAFEEKIRSFPQVSECYVMMGNIDFLLRIVCKDVGDYEQFFSHHLSQMAGVQDINTSVALREVKYTTALPL